MGTKKSIDYLTIKGFKSIAGLNQFSLRRLNVLIGANGVGKSNFVSYFRMLGELIEGRLEGWTNKQGTSDRVLRFGIKETPAIASKVEFGRNSYEFKLEPTVDGLFTFEREELVFNGPYYGKKTITLGSGHKESKLKAAWESSKAESVEDYCYTSITNWKVYHFHDTSETAGMKRLGPLHENQSLLQDASNLAAFLYRVKEEHPETYAQIRKTVQLAIPFFDDFVLQTRKLPSGERQVRLLWKQKQSEYVFWPSQLSDGSIRFICLVTALLQPEPPSTIIIDEPELGLHPYAVTLLGSLLRSASERMQVIVSTQSVSLVNEFSIDDLVVVEREEGASVLKRLEEEDFKAWLEEYSVGELWAKNILGGRPPK